MRKKTPNAIPEGDLKRRLKEINRHLGEEVSIRRNHKNISQSELGAAICVSRQQAQTYEKGANRISAGNLYLIAEKLGVDIDEFFRALDDSLPGMAEGEGHEHEHEQGMDHNSLNGLEPNVRREILSLVEALTKKDCDQ